MITKKNLFFILIFILMLSFANCGKAMLGEGLSGLLNESKSDPVIDTTRPQVGISSTYTSPTNQSIIPVTITFTKTVLGFDETDIVISNGTISNFAGTGNEYNFDITSPTGTVTVNIPDVVCSDLSGNLNEAADEFSILFDNNSPIPAITSDLAPGPVALSPITFQVDFGEVVINFDAGDITLSSGTVGNFINEGLGIYSFEVTEMAQEILTVDIDANACTDQASTGNLAAAQYSIEYDITAPVPVITSTQTGPTTSDDPINFQVDFGEDVIGFIETEILISSGSINNFTDQGSGVYTFDATGMSQGELTVYISPNVCTDTAGNNNSASQQYSIDFFPACTNGVSFNDVCYYAALNLSCNDMCSAQGRTASEETITVIGSSGTNSNCDSVATLLIDAGLVSYTDNTSEILTFGTVASGCRWYDSTGLLKRVIDPVTTLTAVYFDVTRICACGAAP